MLPFDKHKVDIAWNNYVKPLLFYCNTISASLPYSFNREKWLFIIRLYIVTT